MIGFLQYSCNIPVEVCTLHKQIHKHRCIEAQMHKQMVTEVDLLHPISQESTKWSVGKLLNRSHDLISENLWNLLG